MIHSAAIKVIIKKDFPRILFENETGKIDIK